MRGSAIWGSARTLGEFQNVIATAREDMDRRQTIEDALTPARQSAFAIPGRCEVCCADSTFHVSADWAPGGSHGVTPNWREQLVCEGCRLNSRARAAIHILEGDLGASQRDRIYITEQVTRLFTVLRTRYPSIIGSEYLRDGTSPGCCNAQGVRFEDVTSLSFPDESFDFILSFDVLEHVEDYKTALAEIARRLRPGGVLLLTAPFAPNSEATLVRATIGADGEIIHRLPPEYHGDPLGAGGVLCFQHFGWDLLGDMRGAGFSDAELRFYWNAGQGYLGLYQHVIVGTRA